MSEQDVERTMALHEAGRRNGKTLDTAMRWALVKFVVALQMRDAEDQAAASEENGWRSSDASDLYTDVIDTVKRLATGLLDAQGYLDEERRKALEAEA